MYESIKIVPIPDTESDDIFNILTSNLPLTTANITPHTYSDVKTSLWRISCSAKRYEMTKLNDISVALRLH